MNQPLPISTEPLSKEATNMVMRRLRVRLDGKLEFYPTWGSFVFCLIFVGAGAGIVVAGSLTVNDWTATLLVCGVGLVFLLIGLWFLIRNFRKITFDRERGYFWKGRKDPDHVMDKQRLKKFLPFDQIAGVQILEKQGTSHSKHETENYYCAELNLVLVNGEREYLLVNGDVDLTEQDARQLAAYLQKPLLASPGFELHQSSPQDLGDFDLGGAGKSLEHSLVRKIGRKKSLPGFFMRRIFPLIFLVVGLVITKIGVEQFILAGESLEWPEVPGVITDARVVRDTSSDGEVYSAQIEYRYHVEGKEYQSERRSFAEYRSSNRGTHEAIATRYPRGEMVRVFYNPDSPDQAVLEPGRSFMSWGVPAFGLLFAGIGVALTIYIPRSLQKHEFAERQREQRRHRQQGIR